MNRSNIKYINGIASIITENPNIYNDGCLKESREYFEYLGVATILVLFGIIGDKPVIRYPRYSDGARIDLDPKDNDELSYYDDLFSQFGDYLRSQPASAAIQMDISKVWKREDDGIHYVVDNVELQAQQAPISKTQKNARDLRWFIL